MAHQVVRGRTEIEQIRAPGVTVHRHVGPSARFGALRVADDLILEPEARAGLEGYGGSEAVVYVLEGDCVVEGERLEPVRLTTGQAVRARLPDGARGSVRNPAAGSRTRVLVACVAATSTDPLPLLARGPFERDEQGIAWVATHGGAEHVEGSLRLGESTRLGIGTIDPGVEVRFAPAHDRSLLVVVLEGTVELDSRLVDGDARWPLDKGVTMQGVVRARVAVADVPLAFVQQLA